MSDAPEVLLPRLRALTARITRFVLALPSSPRLDDVLQPLWEAAASVSANYRAARRTRSRLEQVAKIERVAAAAAETAQWLDVLAGTDAVTSDEWLKELAALRTEAAALRDLFASEEAAAAAPRPTSRVSLTRFGGAG